MALGIGENYIYSQVIPGIVLTKAEDELGVETFSVFVANRGLN